MFEYPSLKEQNAVHDCLWKQTAKGFKVWWSKDPSVLGSGKTLFKAEEAFAFALAEATNVYPPAYRYVTPPPADEEFARYQSDWVVVSGMNAILRQTQPLDDLFEGGGCKTCGMPLGKRNDQALLYEYSSSHHEDVLRVVHCNTNIRLVSEKFLKVVLGMDGPNGIFREANCIKGKPRSRYFEAVANSSLAAVGCESEEPIGRSCGDCKSRWVAPRGRIGELRYFFDADDMAAAREGWIPFWTGWRTDILVHLDRWRSAQGGRGLKGVVGDRVGILPKALQRPVQYEQVYPVQQ
jgi:hypothetical protein